MASVKLMEKISALMLLLSVLTVIVTIFIYGSTLGEIWNRRKLDVTRARQFHHNISRRLSYFTDDELEKLYLHNEVLREEHSFNGINIGIFRRELLSGVGEKVIKQFIVDQRNTNNHTTLRFNLKTSPRTYFNISPEFYPHLPKDARLGRLKKCSVVGNSGILLGSSCGGFIDSSDFVFRCNAAPLEKFKPDAGTRSNITSLNPSILGIRYGNIKTESQVEQFLEDMRQYRGSVFATCFSTWGYMDLCQKMLSKYVITENRLVMGHPDHFLKFTNFWAEPGRGLTRRISTGFYFTSVAINHCDEVHLYGFWPFASTLAWQVTRPVPYHYYDDMRFDFQIKNRKTHYMSREFAALLQLHNQGVIKIHAGACT